MVTFSEIAAGERPVNAVNGRLSYTVGGAIIVVCAGRPGLG
jgi:hypothetical protein